MSALHPVGTPRAPRAVHGAPGLDPATGDRTHTSHVRMAYRLAMHGEGALMYVHGLGWFSWDGRRFTEDPGSAGPVGQVAEMLRAARTEAQRTGGEIGKRLEVDIRACETAGGVRGVLHIAATLPEFATAARALDADPYLLNVANGTLDLRTLDLRAHDPRDRITKITGGAYRPDVDLGDWGAFLARVLPDAQVRGYLARLAGVGLLGEVREHLLTIVTGTGSNGKTTATNAIGRALGDYAITAEPELFMHRENAHPTGEMDLRGVRWATVSESEEGRRLAEATVKRLTGGDVIRARRMRQDFVEFTPSHTALLVTNFLPSVSGDDPALWRRLRVVPFDVVIPDGEVDPTLGDRLALAADAVLTWAVQGWGDYQLRGLAEPQAVLGAIDRYRDASDAVGQFIAARCTVNPNLTVMSATLHEAFIEWAASNGAAPLAMRPFAQALDRKGYRTARVAQGSQRQGIALAPRLTE